MSTDSNLKFDEVGHDFINFIAGKSRNVKSPLNITQICKEFIEISGSTSSLGSFEQRFYKGHMKIHKMDDFDIDTKVRMLFATSTPVDSNFLYELKKQANVEVDEKDRITSYIANDGILKLKGEHSKRRFTNSDSSNDADGHEDKSSIKKEATKTTESIDTNPIVPSVNSPCSSAEMTPGIQRAHPSNETIHNGPGEPSLSIPLKIKPESVQYQTNPESQEKNRNIKLDEVDNNFLNFIAEKSKNAENPLSPRELCKEFIEFSGSNCSLKYFEQKFYKYRLKIHTMDDFDIDTKVKMMFATSARVDINFLNELKKQATVEVDDKHRITNYIANDGILKLKGDHSRSSKCDDLINFIAEKSKNAENPLNMNQLYGEFVELSGSPCSVGSLGIKFHSSRHKIHELDNFDIDTKVKMLFATSTPVDIGFLNELKEQATVDVDEKGRITSYIAKDGILKLKRDHSHSSKHKFSHAEKRKSQMHQKVSPHRFKRKEEEGELNIEDELGDDNKTITSSGRVSKKRLIFDLSNNPDDHEHKSSTRKKIKKVSNSLDSSSIISSANNPNSSANLTPRIQRTKPSNEVIYDGPGEPSLPIPLKIKPEAIQYQMHPEYRVENKPIPFVQYNMQLQSEHRERLIDEDVEFENTQFSATNQRNEEVKMEIDEEDVICDTFFVPVIESTSPDEFLKLLKNIVKSLGSQMLQDLEKDIEKAMTTLKNENRKVLFKEIEISLRTALTTIIKSAKPKGVSPENTESLKGFLMLLNMIALSNSALTVIQQEIQEAIKGVSDEDKTVSIKNIRIVLENLLLMVSS